MTATPDSAEAAAIPRAPSAMVCPWAHARFWVPAVAVLVIDLWSKRWVFANLAADEVRTWIPGFIELRRSLNDGAVFGSFTGYVSVFIMASLLALLFVLYMFAYSGRHQRLLHIALALILAGAIGNLYDRAFIKADVVEFSAHNQPNFVGKLIREEPHAVVVGHWPEGSRPRQFAKDEVAVRTQGVVRDFIKFVPRFPRSWPIVGGIDAWPWIFNVADSALVIGVAMLLLTSLLERRPATARAQASSLPTGC